MEEAISIPANSYIQKFGEELHKIGLNHAYADSTNFDDTMPPIYDSHFITKDWKFLGIPLLRKEVARIISESSLGKGVQKRYFAYSKLKFDGLLIEVIDENERENLERFAESYRKRFSDSVEIQ